MTDRPDSINAPQTVWNETENIWNYDSTRLAGTTGQYTRVQGPPAAPDEVLSQPRVVSDPAATPSDLSTDRQVAVPPIPTAFRPISGPFSGIRAVRILEQHRAQFWDKDGVVGSVYPSGRPDPTKTEVDAMYQNFLLFTYLPKPLVPSASEFSDLVSPSKVVTTIQNNLVNLGIDNSGSIPEPVTRLSLQDIQNAAVGSRGATEPNLKPYAGQIGFLCSHVNGAYAIPKRTAVYSTNVPTSYNAGPSWQS
jgi:hypothetical protein